MNLSKGEGQKYNYEEMLWCCLFCFQINFRKPYIVKITFMNVWVYLYVTMIPPFLSTSFFIRKELFIYLRSKDSSFINVFCDNTQQKSYDYTNCKQIVWKNVKFRSIHFFPFSGMYILNNYFRGGTQYLIYFIRTPMPPALSNSKVQTASWTVYAVFWFVECVRGIIMSVLRHFSNKEWINIFEKDSTMNVWNFQFNRQFLNFCAISGWGCARIVWPSWS
jgi:hypothetical protein